MEEQLFSKEQIAKVMLQVKETAKGGTLSSIERKIAAKLPEISQNRYDEIFNSELLKNGWVSTSLETFDELNRDPNRKVFPMVVYDGNGLSPSGEDHLKDLLDSFEKEKKEKSQEKKKYIVRNVIIYLILGILIAVLGAYLKGCLGLK